MELNKEQMLKLYQTMCKIRAFEECVGDLYLQGHIWGAVHLYSGEEAVATGACFALEPGDFIASTHRGHGHCIAKGGDLKRMMAEIYGRETGYCKGKGGSMHIADVDAGILGANAIVGDGIGIAVGAALASKVKKSNRVVMAFFGDGATGTGMFHEAMNLASVLKLPVVFVCENNQYAVSTHVSYSLPVKKAAERAAGYQMKAVSVDGSDVVKVFEAARQAVEHVRNGEGPVFVEGLTYRWEGHYKGDPEKYRSSNDVEEWRKNRDPIRLFASKLVAENIVYQEELNRIEHEVQDEVKAAVKYAEESPEPTLSNLFLDLYVDQ